MAGTEPSFLILTALIVPAFEAVALAVASTSNIRSGVSALYVKDFFIVVIGVPYLLRSLLFLSPPP